MESHLQQHRYNIHHNQLKCNHPHANSGLTSYRSAPSSYFSSINIDREFCNRYFDRPASPETERILTGFMNSGNDDVAAVEDPFSQSISPVCQNSLVKEKISHRISQVVPSMNNDGMIIQQQQHRSNISSYASAPQGFHRSSSKPPLGNPGLTSAMEAAYSVGQARLPHMKTGVVNGSNFIRHNSSPIGLFSQIKDDDGYVAIRGGLNVGAGTDTHEEAYFSTSIRLNNSINYSSGLMSPNAEIEVKSNEVNSSIDSECFLDDSAILSDNIGGLKRFRDEEGQELSGLNSSAETQKHTGTQPPPLTHHLSLPKTSAEMANIEKFLEISDSVPCRIRAKRGFAMHPRSIAERVRRTKISERIRRLQELVPNMDRQTNTADMLDLAVDYIKDLQRQFQTLTDIRAHCTCLHKQQ